MSRSTDAQWTIALKMIRNRQWTQEDAAEILGVTQAQVSLVLNGKRRPHLTEQHPELGPRPLQPHPRSPRGPNTRAGQIFRLKQRLVDTTDPTQCWLWIAKPGQEPRTSYRFPGDRYATNMHPAKKMYLLCNPDKPIPPGHTVYQTCDNHLCCNPAHLRVATIADIKRHKYQIAAQTAQRCGGWANVKALYQQYIAQDITEAHLHQQYQVTPSQLYRAFNWSRTSAFDPFRRRNPLTRSSNKKR